MYLSKVTELLEHAQTHTVSLSPLFLVVTTGLYFLHDRPILCVWCLPEFNATKFKERKTDHVRGFVTGTTKGTSSVGTKELVTSTPMSLPGGAIHRWLERVDVVQKRLLNSNCKLNEVL